MFYRGNFIKEMAFFSPDWSYEKVLDKIYEAYSNAIKSRAELTLDRRSKYLY